MSNTLLHAGCIIFFLSSHSVKLSVVNQVSLEWFLLLDVIYCMPLCCLLDVRVFSFPLEIFSSWGISCWNKCLNVLPKGMLLKVVDPAEFKLSPEKMLKKKSRKQNSSSLEHLLLWWRFQPLGNAERGVQSPGGSRSETGFTPVCPELRWVCSWLLLRVRLQGLWRKEGEGICSLYFLLMKIYQGDLSLIGMIFFKFYFDLWWDHGYQPLPVLNFNGGCDMGVTVSW